MSPVEFGYGYSESLLRRRDAYLIKLKIEKVKELIQAQEHNFTEISHVLGYSHINHLSAQFKFETGMSLSDYKSQQNNLRNPLDKII